MEGEAAAVGHFSEPLNFGNGGNTVFMPGVKLNNFSARLNRYIFRKNQKKSLLLFLPMTVHVCILMAKKYIQIGMMGLQKSRYIP